jgi:S-adenosylmethionine decarboxylase
MKQAAKIHNAEVAWIDAEAQSKAINYGIHLTMRIGQIENCAALEGQNVAAFLTDLVGRIGMRILAGPLVAEENGDPMHRGWSGVIILYESHAAIHTYPELGQAFLDIFSCKPYDVALVREILSEAFGKFTILEQSIFDRGVHWGSNAEAEMAEWRAQRDA